MLILPKYGKNSSFLLFFLIITPYFSSFLLFSPLFSLFYRCNYLFVSWLFWFFQISMFKYAYFPKNGKIRRSMCYSSQFLFFSPLFCVFSGMVPIKEHLHRCNHLK